MRTGTIILHIVGQGNGPEDRVFRAIPAKILTAENAEVAENLLAHHRREVFSETYYLFFP